MAESLILQLPSSDCQIQTVFRRRQRARGKRVHSARRIVGLVEIDHRVPVRVGWRRVEKTPGAVGFAAIAAIAENQEQAARSEEHTSELQSLMRNSYAVFC